MKNLIAICYSSLLIAAFSLHSPKIGFALTLDTFETPSKVESIDIGIVNSNVISSSTAIGGTRTTRTFKTDGILRVTLEALQSTLNHSQDTNVKGRSQVVWDGDLDPLNINFAGLNGVDFTQDEGTAIVLDKVSFDYASSLPIDITIKVFDSTDPFGGKFAYKTLSLSRVYNEETINIPYIDFITQGSPTPFDFKKVGAVSIDILGVNSGVDLTIANLKTNGRCPQIPNVQGKVLDDCGVCGGSNQDKDQCGICFGGNADQDQCGVCFGGNRDLDDCGVCGGQNMSKDLCGICGGNNSSCKDCAGIPNGTNTTDVCGVCGGDGTSCQDCNGVPFGTSKLDACGVCDGNGKSCLNCTETDLGIDVEALLNKAKEQKANALFFLQRLSSADKKYASNAKRQINSLYLNMVNNAKLLVTKVSQCSELCRKSDQNASVLSTHNTYSEKLYKIMIDILNRPVTQKGGKCKGDIKACIKRQKDASIKKRSFQTLARKILKDTKLIVSKIPGTFSVCD